MIFLMLTLFPCLSSLFVWSKNQIYCLDLVDDIIRLFCSDYIPDLVPNSFLYQSYLSNKSIHFLLSVFEIQRYQDHVLKPDRVPLFNTNGAHVSSVTLDALDVERNRACGRAKE